MMPTDAHAADDPVRAMRSRRVRQISSFVALAALITAPIYMVSGEWHVALPLLAGVMAMGVCYGVDRSGHTPTAGALLVGAVTLLCFALQWLDRGIYDSSVLAFPIVLLLAGMLIGPRSFIGLLMAMLGWMAFMLLATELWALRPLRPPVAPADFFRDAVLILLVGGWSVWFIISDLRAALLQLREQIGKYRESQVHLTHLTQHDALTGLPNRTHERERVEQEIVHARRRRDKLALLFIDLDNFKAINDTLGHDAGDELLLEIAMRLRDAVREADIVARHAGDEFVICLTDVDAIDDVTAAAGNVLACLARPLTLKEVPVSASCSIGVAVYPEDGADYETLLRHADLAMYQAKQAGRNTFRCYDTAMNADIQASVLLVSGLREALAERQFVLHYQPVVDLASGRWVGCEALVRWVHPERGMVPPGLFIPAAEKSGLIVDIGNWVLGEACAQLARWRDAGLPPLVMAVNVSPVQFRRGPVEQSVARALAAAELPPACLELEITESTLVHDKAATAEELQRLRALGVRLSIDDFGTGYSNLSYLQRFAVNKLKVDQSFVGRMGLGAQDRAIVRAIVQMAHGLELTTTAEGIEDDATRQALVAVGCEQGQGYFFSRPLSADAFATAMAAHAVPPPL